MKEKFTKFMQGRYGTDQLVRTTSVMAIVFILLSMIFRQRLAAAIFDSAGIILIIYSYFRMFSRNISKRYEENQRFLAETAKIRNWFTSQKKMVGQRKEYHFYRCPSCKQRVRVPRGKGKIEITCPKCKERFIKKS